MKMHSNPQHPYPRNGIEKMNVMEGPGPVFQHVVADLWTLTFNLRAFNHKIFTTIRIFCYNCWPFNFGPFLTPNAGCWMRCQDRRASLRTLTWQASGLLWLRPVPSFDPHVHPATLSLPVPQPLTSGTKCRGHRKILHEQVGHGWAAP